MSESLTPMELGMRAEMKAGQWLNSRGIKTMRSTHHRAPFDLLANGWRVEVKTATLNPKNGRWAFNIHRHGKVDESNCDFYLLVLGDVPHFKHPLHIIQKAPVGVPTIGISIRSLIILNTYEIGSVDLLRTPNPEAARWFNG